MLEKWFLDILWLWNTRYPGTIWNDHISHQTGSSENHHLQKNPIFDGICDQFPGGCRSPFFHGEPRLGVPCTWYTLPWTSLQGQVTFGRVTNRWYKDLFVDLCKGPRDETLPFCDRVDAIAPFFLVFYENTLWWCLSALCRVSLDFVRDDHLK